MCLVSILVSTLSLNLVRSFLLPTFLRRFGTSSLELVQRLGLSVLPRVPSSLLVSFSSVSSVLHRRLVSTFPRLLPCPAHSTQACFLWPLRHLQVARPRPCPPLQEARLLDWSCLLLVVSRGPRFLPRSGFLHVLADFLRLSVQALHHSFQLLTWSSVLPIQFAAIGHLTLLPLHSLPGWLLCPCLDSGAHTVFSDESRPGTLDPPTFSESFPTPSPPYSFSLPSRAMARRVSGPGKLENLFLRASFCNSDACLLVDFGHRITRHT